MKIREFTYSGKSRQLYVLREDTNYMEGIDISHLDDDEKAQFKEIVEDFWKKIDPFMKKAYRKFDAKKMESSAANVDI